MTAPSFLSGLARVLDLFGVFDEYLPMDDAEAIASDWTAVGKDIQDAIEKFSIGEQR